ncbi:MAG: MBL fold metallo-hydrolase [Candidatus Aminicenantes bacterium]|nr:MBL fold metallo-hydrolase [Candidatus Aminicenantes bacterium]
MNNEFSLTFHGVRGSYPVPGEATRRYGGNTSSLLFEIAGQVVIFDAGTGIIQAGRWLDGRLRSGQAVHVFLTHLHSDHIMGLPFFAPLFNPEVTVVVHCPESGGAESQRALEALFIPPYSPITLRGIKARLDFQPLAASKEVSTLELENGVEVAHIMHDSHPRQGVFILRIACGRRRVVYATDVESPGGFDPVVGGFIAGADLLVHDSQYFERDYFSATDPRAGFGHSTVAMAANNALRSGVKRLFLFHFDPRYSDAMLEEMLTQARQIFPASALAREGERIDIK